MSDWVLKYSSATPVFESPVFQESVNNILFLTLFSRKYNVDVTIHNESCRTVITDSTTLSYTYIISIGAETGLISVSDRL